MIELVGGYDFARKLCLDAIENGKHIAPPTRRCSPCTATRSSAPPSRASTSRGRGQRHPRLRAAQGLAANQIQSLYGILNGTTNFVLTEMERTGAG